MGALPRGCTTVTLCPLLSARLSCTATARSPRRRLWSLASGCCWTDLKQSYEQTGAAQLSSGDQDREDGVLTLSVSISWADALMVERARGTQAGHLGLWAKRQPRGHPSSTRVVEPERRAHGRQGASAALIPEKRKWPVGQARRAGRPAQQRSRLQKPPLGDGFRRVCSTLCGTS